MSTDFRSLIAAKRDGHRHSREELEQIAEAAARHSVPSYQLSAWLMAAFLHPLDLDETTWLTQAMAGSGARLDLSGLPKPWIDKHSTGGIGDKTSIVLLPLLAACGATVVKMSGPGLGITGGTVDKLKSIPGFRMELSPEELLEQAKRIGVAITGQTPDLAPADKTLYDLRSATATTQSVPLIVSSILSKKIAGGAETIVLDVKCGSGGFMTTLPEAEELAAWLLRVGRNCGLNIRTTITDMNQPLGSAVGNALEVREAIDVLTKEPEQLPGPTRRFRRLCIYFAGEALAAAGLAKNEKEGQEAAQRCLSLGKAAQKAAHWIAAQGGPENLELASQQLPKSRIQLVVSARQTGFIEGIDAASVGEIVIELGGGRKRKGAAIDYSVGVVLAGAVGDAVVEGKPLCTVHAAGETQAQTAAAHLSDTFKITNRLVEPADPVLKALP